MPENSNIYSSLFPNGVSQGGMYQTFNSGGYNNILNNSSSINTGSNMSDTISGGGGFNLDVGNTLGALGSLAAGSGEVTSKNVKDKTTLNYASKGVQLGSKLGPWGALIGGIGGGLYGAMQGGEMERKMKHHERNVISTEGLVSQMQSNIKDSQSSVSDFWQGQKNATENAYSVGHIDNFLQKNRV
jgi:hypothetical protein